MDRFNRMKLQPQQIPASAVAKWSWEVLDEGFVPFPKRLLRCLSEVLPGETAIDDLRVVLSVADYRRENLSRPPSIAYLAFNAGMSEAEFERRLADLEARNLIKCTGTVHAIEVDLGGIL